ncbi:polysaccharide pyruvyl transferase family protein [Arenibacter palladensis]|uniref:polysaccharide pyruvyl transferase family protein n=1 Tax=Arenibacter palladensis TaxID=237373 RepID=UPI002FCEAB09
MKKAVFLVATQYDNLGDLIINKCLIDELTKHVDLHIDTYNTSEEFIKCFESNSKVNFLKKSYGFSFKNASLLKYLFSDKVRFNYLFKSPGPIGYAKSSGIEDRIRGFVFNQIFKTAHNKGCKSYVIGSEVHLRNESEVKGYQKFSKYFYKHLVRSKANVKFLKSIGIDQADYIPDLCFLLYDKVSRNTNRTKVGISFRDLQDDKLNENIVRSVKTYVDFYLSKGQNVVFFYQVKRDYQYTKDLFSAYKGTAGVSFMEKCLGFEDIAAYSSFESVISNRLHVLLLGFIHNSMTVPLINDNDSTNKIKGIYTSIGSSTQPITMLSESQLKNSDSTLKQLMEETELINEEQNRMCKQRISEIFK